MPFKILELIEGGDGYRNITFVWCRFVSPANGCIDNCKFIECEPILCADGLEVRNSLFVTRTNSAIPVASWN